MADLHRLIKVGILTVSDTCYNGKAEDKSGENLKAIVESGQCFKGTVSTKDIIHDEVEDIKAKLLHWSDSLKLDVILTTGGTGFAPRDVTPEATRAIIDKEALGMTVAMIKGSLDITPLAMLSRLVCGIRGSTLIINLPGSTKGSAECLQIVGGSIAHAVDLLRSDTSSVATTHTVLQSEGIRPVASVHASDADSSFSNGRGKRVPGKSSRSSNTQQRLQSDIDQQSAKLLEDRLALFCNKLTDFLEELEGTVPSNFSFIDCHINDDTNVSSRCVSLMAKFMQVLVFVIEDFTRTLGLSQQFNSVSLSSQISKAVESKMKSWIENCRQEQCDPTFLSSASVSSEDMFSKRDSRYNVDETDSTKSFISREAMYPSYPAESHVCKSASYIGNSRRIKKHTSSSFETDLYCKRNEGMSGALSSGVLSLPNSFKRFNPSCVKHPRQSDIPRILTYASESQLSSSVMTRKLKSLNNCATRSIPIDQLMEEKQTPDNFSREDVEKLHAPETIYEPGRPKSASFVISDASPFVNVSNSFELQKNGSSSNEYFDSSLTFGKHGIYESCPSYKFPIKCSRGERKYLNENETKALDNNRSYSPIIDIKKYSSSSISTLSKSSPESLLSPPSKSLTKTSPGATVEAKPVTSDENIIQHFPCNIMSAKIHNIHNQGELVNVPVGKAFNCFVNDHPFLKGISLYKGKRDIKKLLVRMSRQEDATGQATSSWKRGKEVLERNRFDDFFQLTSEGTEEQQQVLCGRKRDQYVVNWYMWCPGHGNCKRKCGGYGKCLENCKGMLHKQDRHNCSLMVNLKLFLSDLSTWRVHITGTHLPEQTETATADTSSSSHEQPKGQIKEKLDDDFHRYSFTDSSKQSDDKGQSLSSDTPVTSDEANNNMETSSCLSNISSNSIISGGNIAQAFYDNDLILQQSKMPSKKRISKMLSSLKRRRQNKSYGFMKLRPTCSNVSHNDRNNASKPLSYFKSYTESFDGDKHPLPGSASTTYTGMTPQITLPASATPSDQTSLLSELSSYLPAVCANERDQERGVFSTTECLSGINDLESNSVMTNKSTSDIVPPLSAYTCHTTTGSKYTDSITNYISTHPDLPVDVQTTDLPHDDAGDIYHSAISLPNFHQPFLHANSLTEILTEAGVNISEQFDDLNSSINRGSDSSLTRDGSL